MLKIYEYNRLAPSAEDQLTLMAAESALDNEAFVEVGAAHDEIEARTMMRDRIYASVHVDHIPGVTRPAYAIRDLPSFAKPAGVLFGMMADGQADEE